MTTLNGFSTEDFIYDFFYNILFNSNDLSAFQIFFVGCLFVCLFAVWIFIIYKHSVTATFAFQLFIEIELWKRGSFLASCLKSMWVCRVEIAFPLCRRMTNFRKQNVLHFDQTMYRCIIKSYVLYTFFTGASPFKSHTFGEKKIIRIWPISKYLIFQSWSFESDDERLFAL